jgi:hypothetical protein
LSIPIFIFINFYHPPEQIIFAEGFLYLALVVAWIVCLVYAIRCFRAKALYLLPGAILVFFWPVFAVFILMSLGSAGM